MASFGRARSVPIGIGDLANDQPRAVRMLPLYVAGLAAALGAALGMSGDLEWGGGGSLRPSSAGVVGEATLPTGVTLPIVNDPIEVSFKEVTVPDLQALAAPIEAVPAAPEPVVPFVPVVRAASEPVVPVTTVAPIAQAVAPAPTAAQPVQVQPVVVASTAKPNFHLPNVSSGPATDLEQRLLSGINAERATAGLPAYVLNAGLTKIARTRSQQLFDQDYFGHVDPFGYSMYVELLAHFGFRYAWAGENLALNNFALSESPERALMTLMKSPTHRANILANDFFRVGIGEVTAPDGRHFYAMIFIG